MADGLSELSSENLTAAVTSLLQKPLPECHFIKPKLASTKHLTTTGPGVFRQVQTSHQTPRESHSVNLQPLISSIQDSLPNSCQHFPKNESTNPQISEIKSGHYVSQQQFAGSSHGKLLNGSVSPKLIKFSGDYNHPGVTSTPDSLKDGEDSVHGLVSFSTVQDSSCTLNKVIKPQASHGHRENVQTNQPLLTGMPVQLGVNAINGLGLIQTMVNQSTGFSLLKQLISAQNQGSLVNPTTIPVLGGLSQVPVARPEIPVETSFSQVSPTQPIQNLVQNLFSSPGSSQPAERSVEVYRAIPLPHGNMETSAQSKHATPSISSPTKDQENTYSTHIKLLLEAINKNKTLSPQQVYQIQKSAFGQIESDNILPGTWVLNESQPPVSQGEGQEHQPAAQVIEKPALQSCPMVVQGTTPEGHIQLVPLSDLNVGNLQHIPKVTSGKCSSDFIQF